MQVARHDNLNAQAYGLPTAGQPQPVTRPPNNPLQYGPPMPGPNHFSQNIRAYNPKSLAGWLNSLKGKLGFNPGASLKPIPGGIKQGYPQEHQKRSRLGTGLAMLGGLGAGLVAGSWVAGAFLGGPFALVGLAMMGGGLLSAGMFGVGALAMLYLGNKVVEGFNWNHPYQNVPASNGTSTQANENGTSHAA